MEIDWQVLPSNGCRSPAAPSNMVRDGAGQNDKLAESKLAVHKAMGWYWTYSILAREDRREGGLRHLLSATYIAVLRSPPNSSILIHTPSHVTPMKQQQGGSTTYSYQQPFTTLLRGSQQPSHVARLFWPSFGPRCHSPTASSGPHIVWNDAVGGFSSVCRIWATSKR